jgi:DNA-binding transcriptional MerR regulator
MLTKHQEYSVGEAAEILGVSVGWMRLAERCGSIPRARRNAIGWRIYSNEDIARLQRLGLGERKRRLENSGE